MSEEFSILITSAIRHRTSQLEASDIAHPPSDIVEVVVGHRFTCFFSVTVGAGLVNPLLPPDRGNGPLVGCPA